VKLTKCNDRELVSLDARIPIPWFDEGYISHEDTISQERDIQVADLRASYLEIARDEVKHIFHVSNWLDVPDSTIHHWQQRLLKREF